MMLKRLCLFLLFLVLTVSSVKAQPFCNVTQYDNLRKQVWDVGYMVQDHNGFMWFSTTDGLYRFDGYEFKGFKSDVGDGLKMTTGNIKHTYRDVCGDLWCLIDKRAFMFDVSSYKWTDVLVELEAQEKREFEIAKIRPLQNGETWLITVEGKFICVKPGNLQSVIIKAEGAGQKAYICSDRFGKTWLFDTDVAYLYRGDSITKYDFRCMDRVIAGKDFWMLDNDGHLNILDTCDYQIKPFESALQGVSFYALHSFRSGCLMALAENSTFMIGLDKKPVRVTLPSRVERFFEQKDGNILIQTVEHALLRFCPNDKSLTMLTDNCRKDTYIFEDEYQTVWLLGKDASMRYIAHGDNKVCEYDINGKLLPGYYFCDNQSNLWLVNPYSIYKLSFGVRNYDKIGDSNLTHVKSVYVDSKKRYWITDRTTGTVKVFANDNTLLGYLGRDGVIRDSYTNFANIYSIHEDSNGQIWLGSKPDGVFRLREIGDGQFDIDHFEEDVTDKYSLHGVSVFGITEDARGRIWLATHRGGINCITNPTAQRLRFINSKNELARYDKSYNQKTYYITVTSDNVLLAGSSEGLMVADANVADLSKIDIRLHKREPNRKTSLSCSSVRHIYEDSQHRVFICTESGGVNQILSDNLLAEQLEFRHYCSHVGFPTDIAQSIIEHDSSLWVVGRNVLVEFDPDSEAVRANAHLESENVVFSGAVPVLLPDGKLLFGMQYDGALALDLNTLKRNTFSPSIVITEVKVMEDYLYSNRDTIILQPDERNLNISFAALDFSNAENINYAYKIGNNAKWNYIGGNRSLSFVDMRPGTYLVTLNSTNGEGLWVDNHRTLTIIVKPSFWETRWALLLYILIIIGAGYAVISFRRYILRIKRQQRETLELYMQLLNQNEQERKEKEEKRLRLLAKTSQTHDDALMKCVMEFIKDNIGNSDVSIDDMAYAAATSRAVLNRKVKSITGMTPVDLIKTARIERAAKMLKDGTCTINEVAFTCGFSDPKYFSKCFKAATGFTPSDYRLGGEPNVETKEKSSDDRDK